jgi:hypothetical protein
MIWKKELAGKLAERLDAEVIDPVDGDSAELRDLLETYACLESAIEEPDPNLQGRVKWLLKGRSFRDRVAAWGAAWRRWRSARRLHPALAGGAATIVVLLLLVGVPAMFRPIVQNAQVPNSRVRVPGNNEDQGFFSDEVGLREDDGFSGDDRPGLDRRFVYELEEDSSGFDGVVKDGILYSSVSDKEVAGAGRVDILDTDGSSSGIDVDDGRMIVRRAALAFIVEDAETGFIRVQEIAAEYGGGIYSLESGKTAQGSLKTIVSIEVPVETCDVVLTELRMMDAELIAERITSQDVTATYVDLDARVHNLELAEQEIQDLLESAQERGEKSSEIMAIYNRLTTIRQQIEQLKGQMMLIARSAALARIDVSLIPEEIAPEPPPAPGFDPGRVLGEAWEEVVEILENIATFFIRAFAYAPLSLPPVLVVVLVVWLIVRRSRRRRAAEAGEEDVEA